GLLMNFLPLSDAASPSALRSRSVVGVSLPWQPEIPEQVTHLLTVAPGAHALVKITSAQSVGPGGAAGGSFPPQAVSRPRRIAGRSVFIVVSRALPSIVCLVTGSVESQRELLVLG